LEVTAVARFCKQRASKGSEMGSQANEKQGPVANLGNRHASLQILLLHRRAARLVQRTQLTLHGHSSMSDGTDQKIATFSLYTMVKLPLRSSEIADSIEITTDEHGTTRTLLRRIWIRKNVPAMQKRLAMTTAATAGLLVQQAECQRNRGMPDFQLGASTFAFRQKLRAKKRMSTERS
jgi:hypothetical protein